MYKNQAEIENKKRKRIKKLKMIARRKKSKKLRLKEKIRPKPKLIPFTKGFITQICKNGKIPIFQDKWLFKKQ